MLFMRYLIILFLCASASASVSAEPVFLAEVENCESPMGAAAQMFESASKIYLRQQAVEPKKSIKLRVEHEIAVGQWAMNVCFIQTLARQVDFSCDLSQLEQNPRLKQVMVELAIFQGMHSAQKAQELSIQDCGARCSRDQMTRAALGNHLLEAIRSFQNSVERAVSENQSRTLRQHSDAVLEKLQNKVRKINLELKQRFGTGFG